MNQSFVPWPPFAGVLRGQAWVARNRFAATARRDGNSADCWRPSRVRRAISDTDEG